MGENTLLYGTLDTLILRTLSDGPRHGYGIARWLEARTDARIQVDESSLYPALYRLRKKGLLASEWGKTELGRRAKFYTLTSKGQKALESQSREWQHFADAVQTVLASD